MSLKDVHHADASQGEAAGERKGNTLNGFKDLRTQNGSSQSQNLALAVLYVPCSLDSGRGSLHIVGRIADDEPVGRVPLLSKTELATGVPHS